MAFKTSDDPRLVPAYSVAEAAHYLRMPEGTLRSWVAGSSRGKASDRRPSCPWADTQFEPGEELQHGTSPHEVQVGGRKHKALTASAVLGYSRRLFFQISPTFQLLQTPSLRRGDFQGIRVYRSDVGVGPSASSSTRRIGQETG